MSGEFTVKLPQRIPTAGVSGDTQKKAGAADAQLLMRQQSGTQVSLTETVSISSEARSLSQTTSVSFTYSRQTDVYGPRLPSSPAKAEGSESTKDAKALSGRLTAEDVAKNVLGFVEDRLRREKAAGASEEKLTRLFEQAKEGISRGYSEALDELEESDLLTPELKEDIAKGRERIDEGLDKLAVRLLGNGEADVASADKEPREDNRSEPARKPKATSANTDANTVANNVVEKAPAFSRKPIAEALSVQRSSYAEANIGIQVKTRDGDVVTLSAYQIDASSFAADYQGGNGRFAAAEGSGVFQSNGYSFSLEGELDEEELKALEDLVVQVQGMADQFFEGDFASAFESAMQLQPDTGEIASYAVSLSSRQIEQVSSRYGTGGEAAGSRYEPLARQAGQMRDALGMASVFEDRAALVQQMIESFARQKNESSKQLDNYLDFTRQLASKIEQNFLAVKPSQLTPEN
jgi:hypothetical protein